MPYFFISVPVHRDVYIATLNIYNLIIKNMINEYDLEYSVDAWDV
jgi:hypothetical protein